MDIDWIRAADDGPKEMPNGKLVLNKLSGACFAVDPEDLRAVRELIDEAMLWYDDEISGGDETESPSRE